MNVLGNINWKRQAYYQKLAQIPLYERWLLNRKFRIKGLIHTLRDRRGSGTFGSVWAATTVDGRRVAVKVFNFRRTGYSVDPAVLLKSFYDEVKMTYKMRYSTQHVVNIFAFDLNIRKRVALVSMELGDDSLEDRARRLHALHVRPGGLGTRDGDYISAGDRKSIWIQLVSIAIELFRHNVIHRDMKPANLVFFGPILKIVDLGIAQKEIVGFDSRMLGGTPFYSAPECMTGAAPVTSKADVWSVGAVLYFLTYGVPPTYWSSQPPSGVAPTRSAAVQEILAYCLRSNQNERPWHQQLAQHPLTSNPMVA